MRFQSVTTNIQSATAVYCKCSGFCAVALNCKCTKTHKKASIFFLLQVQWVTLRRDTNPVLVGFPVKIPILICSMVLHAYLLFSALKKDPLAPRTVNYSSGLQVGNRGLHDTSGAFPLYNKFSESSREKRIGITGASNPCVMDTGYKTPILIFPPENVKAII